MTVPEKFDSDFPYAHFPIYRIPYFWLLALGDVNDWRENCRATVAVRLQACRHLMVFFEDVFGITYAPFDFFSAKKDLIFVLDEDPYMDCFGEPKDVITKRMKEPDAELYMAVNSFHFQKAEELLRLGANPLAYCYVNDDNSVTATRYRMSGYSINLTDAWKKQSMVVDEEALSLLFRYAAATAMDRLLKPYVQQFSE